MRTGYCSRVVSCVCPGPNTFDISTLHPRLGRNRSVQRFGELDPVPGAGHRPQSARPTSANGRSASTLTAPSSVTPARQSAAAPASATTGTGHGALPFKALQALPDTGRRTFRKSLLGFLSSQPRDQPPHGGGCASADPATSSSPPGAARGKSPMRTTIPPEARVVVAGAHRLAAVPRSDLLAQAMHAVGVVPQPAHFRSNLPHAPSFGYGNRTVVR